MNLSLSHWLPLHTVVVLVALATYAAVSVALRQRRHPSAAMGWVLLLALAPYVGLPLFLMFGSRKVVRARRVRVPLQASLRELLAQPGGRMRALALGLRLPDAVPCEDLVVHADGMEALARLHAVVQGAQHTLEVSTFLIGRDAVGDALVHLLASRAREGVHVRLMVDGVGRYMGGMANLRPLRDAGVQVALFVRPWWSPLRGRVNLRNHRKLVIADGQWVWSGGRNLAAEYFTGTQGKAPWTDLSFDLRGPLGGVARAQFERDWSLASTGEPRRAPSEVHVGEPPHGTALVQLLPSGPDHADDTLYELLLDACYNATERIVAVTPYFVPDPALLMAFALAARRGVQVDLLLPRHSNHRMADLARPAAVRELVDSGAQVWLAPGMLHAKLVVVDETVALAGTLNLDSRSLFLNYELMVAFYDPAAIARFTQWAALARSSAARVAPQRVTPLREVGEGLVRWLTFQL